MFVQENILQIHRPTLKGRELFCTYTFNSEVYENIYKFPQQIRDLNSPELLKLCEWVSVVTSFGLFSIEYFDRLVADFYLSKEEIAFFEKLMFLGLGEFRFTNKISIAKTVKIQGDSAPGSLEPVINSESKSASLKPLLLNGGGKDGSVSALLLKEAGIDFSWFQRGNTVAQADVVKAWDAPTLIVERKLDPKRQNRKYAGHRPMSAGIAFLAILSGYLYGYNAVIASNELSANEGNFILDGVQVNHQYSKSLEFEKDIQELLKLAGINIQYFSLLRPLHELQIAVIAARLKDNQLEAITSCNNGTKTGKWCMACAKCAFVVLVITAADPQAAIKIWNTDAINTPGLMPYFIELLDPEIDKPLECVGTLQECQLAAHMIMQNRDPRLTLKVKKIMQRYADKGHTALLQEMGESAIPKEYLQVIKLMKKYLA